MLSDVMRNEFTVGLGTINLIPAMAASSSRDELFDEGDCMLGNIVETHETYGDFVAAHGQPSSSRMTIDGRQIHVWTAVQFRKGQARGSLYLMEFEEAGVSASMFTGGGYQS